MKKCLFVLLIAVLAAGCASVSATPTIPASSGNQEERIRKILVGTWNGYVKDSNKWYPWRINYPERSLTIYKVYREQGNDWTVNAILNGESLKYARIYVYDNNAVSLEIGDNYGGLYFLEVYKNTHMLGKVQWDPVYRAGFEVLLRKELY